MDRTQLKQILLQALEQATRTIYADLSETTSLQTSLGLDSLGLVSVLIEVQDRLDVSLQLDEVRDVETVGDLLTLLEQKLACDLAKNAA